MTDQDYQLLRSIDAKLGALVSLMVAQMRSIGRTEPWTQADLIIQLAATGIGPTDISKLLGTTTGNVNPILSRHRSSQRGKAMQARQPTPAQP